MAAQAHTASAVPTAATTRRISDPATTASAKASSVQAGKAGPWIAKYCGYSRAYPSALSGENHHDASAATAAPPSSSAAARTAILPVSRRQRADLVQANRNVPRSISRATTAAPVNVPAVTGTTSSSTGIRPVQMPKFCWNCLTVAEHAGVRFCTAQPLRPSRW